MLRIDCLRSIYDHLQDCLVVTIMGATAAELQSLGHRKNFFYLQHSMGLASSLGLGLALSLPDQRVVVFDGDGSVLMNLGGLTTIARYAPQNLIHVVFDNESLFSTGGFPTATRTGTDLAGIAHAAGIREVQTVRALDEFRLAFDNAMRGGRLAFITAKVEATGPAQYEPSVALLENRFQFRRHIQEVAQSAKLIVKRSDIVSPAANSRRSRGPEREGTMESFDVVVIGSGVAGAPAAMLLARAGHKVLLIDRHEFPRDALSTHFIWPRGVSYLSRWGLAEPILQQTPHFTTLEMNVEGISLKGSVPIAHLESRFRLLHGDSRGTTNIYCGPRRHFLDTFLQEQARKAGADVRDGTAFTEPIVEEGVVQGIHAVDSKGNPISVRARLVIGADGMHSAFAKKIGARTTHSWELSTFAYWGYFSGIQRDELAFYRKGRLGMAIFPTSGGTHMVLAYGPTGWWSDFRKDAEINFHKTIAFCDPEIGALVRDGRNEEPFKACGHMPAFHRELRGPGWVLIGDASSFKDQATAMGITHAFRDAELVSHFVHKALAGETTLDAALADYTSIRAADYMDYFNLVCQVAEMNVYQSPEVEFFYSIHKDQARVDEIISQFGDTLPLSPPAAAAAVVGSGLADFMRAYENRAEAYRTNPFQPADLRIRVG